MGSKFRYLVILIGILFAGCFTDSKQSYSQELLDFDISPDGKSIIFSWGDNDNSVIYKSDINGNSPQELFHPQDNFSSYLPRYSPDGSKIVLIRRNSKAKKSSIWVVDYEGKNLKEVVDNERLNIEAIFSYDGKSLYFTKASDYSGGPKSRKAAHGFDIYSFDFYSKKIEKISNFKAYNLYYISSLNNDDILFSMRDEVDGVFIYQKKINELKKIIVVNDTVNNSQAYSNPISINNNNIICSSYYDIVKIDLNAQKEKVILSSNGSQFKAIKYNHKISKIFFQKRDIGNSIYSINTDGSGLKEIPLSIK